MKTMSKSRLKAQMLQVFRDIETGGEPLIVTDHGTPVLKIEPIAPKRTIFEVFAGFQQSDEIPDDVLGPETEEWGDYQ